MKKIFYLLFAVVTILCAVECSAQSDFWAWQNGQYTKFEKADSITFVDPTANPKVADSNIIDGHEYVDLGLPSGTKWATCNLGASLPEEMGDYYAWGETTTKTNYSWSTYKWCEGTETTLTKYCTDSKYGTVDSIMTLEADDDAATANWGSSWKIPTLEEVQELIDGCTWLWFWDYKGKVGRLGTSKTNGNTIFIPAQNYIEGSDSYGNNIGLYLSASLSSKYYTPYAVCLYNTNASIKTGSKDRFAGLSVRAVVNK